MDYYRYGDDAMNEQRRGFLGALAAFLGVGAVVASEPREAAPTGRPIEGVGVLRYPQNEEAFAIAKNLADTIRQGSIIAMSNNRDFMGQYEWDFRIEGGDPKQVRVERQRDKIDEINLFCSGSSSSSSQGVASGTSWSGSALRLNGQAPSEG